MYKIGTLIFMVAQSSIHAGSGTDLGIVDMPIQREIHTGYPKIESSGVKGCIRRIFEDKDIDGDAVDRLFGPEDAGSEAKAGALAFTDARMLLFPIKSLKGTFAYTTCPNIIERFKSDLGLISVDASGLDNISFGDITNAIVGPNSNITLKNGAMEYVVLEEYAMRAERNDNAQVLAQWLSDRIFSGDTYSYWRERLLKSLVILPNDVFRDLVEQFTEVIARTSINNETKTVKTGGLWYEENIPADSVMYSLVMAGEVNYNIEGKGIFGADNHQAEYQKVMKFFCENMPAFMQIGGNANIGKGIVHIQMLEGGCE